jgi:hypothetical protein
MQQIIEQLQVVLTELLVVYELVLELLKNLIQTFTSF